jgi:N-acyl homoserine lactone hydrolase
MTDIEIVPLELAEFRFPDPELAGRRGVVMGYAVRHPDGVLLFDTGFGFGNAELDETYHPVGRPIVEVLRQVGIERDEVTAVANCHLHADHAGQNGAFPGTQIHVQTAEWELAHTTDHTILEWIDAPGATYLLVDGDHEVTPEIRLLATPGHTRGHQSLVLDTAEGPVVLAGQACYTAAEWAGEPDVLEGRSGAPDRAAYDSSIERLRALEPVRVYFGHDRVAWSAGPDRRPTPAILPGPC